jgi:phosphatidate cytidylyltransferase
MLRQRIITALLLAIAVICCIFILPESGFGLFILIILLLAAWEWANLLGLSMTAKVIYCASIIVLVGITWWLESYKSLLWPFLLTAGIYWVYVLVWLVRYTRQPASKDHTAVLLLSGLVVLIAPWIALMGLRSLPEFGAGYVLFLLIMIAAADTGAYFSGRLWGRHKLAPQISPGKTWEGVLGAIAATLVIALSGALWFQVEPLYWMMFVGICLLTVLFSIIGDLFESMIKRQKGVKDSGNLLPGHGGVLDRIDSLTAAAPLFLLGLQTLSG